MPLGLAWKYPHITDAHADWVLIGIFLWLLVWGTIEFFIRRKKPKGAFRQTYRAWRIPKANRKSPQDAIAEYSDRILWLRYQQAQWAHRQADSEKEKTSRALDDPDPGGPGISTLKAASETVNKAALDAALKHHAAKDALDDHVIKNLLSGEWVAWGYKDDYSFSSTAVPIPVDQWNILKLDADKGTAITEGLKYVKLKIGRK